MNSETKERLVEAVCDVLEQDAFMIGEEHPRDGLKVEAEGFLHGSIRFDGPARGRLQGAMSAELCAELAANRLAVEPDEEEAAAHAADALGELLNVVCGQLLTGLYDPRAVFKISNPQVMELAPGAWQALTADGDAVGFSIEESPAVFVLSLDGEM